MRPILRFGTLALAFASTAALAAPAKPPTYPLELSGESSFSIKGEYLPAGCSVLFGIEGKENKFVGKVTCQTKAAWEQGFKVTGDMVANCPKEDAQHPYVCTVTKKNS